MLYSFCVQKRMTPEQRMFNQLTERFDEKNACIRCIVKFIVFLCICLLSWSRLIWIYDAWVFDPENLSKKLDSGSERTNEEIYQNYSSSKTNKGRAFLIELLFENIPQLILQLKINQEIRGNILQWTTFEIISLCLSILGVIKQVRTIYAMLKDGGALPTVDGRNKAFINEFLALADKSIYF